MCINYLSICINFMKCISYIFLLEFLDSTFHLFREALPLALSVEEPIELVLQGASSTEELPSFPSIVMNPGDQLTHASLAISWRNIRGTLNQSIECTFWFCKLNFSFSKVSFGCNSLHCQMIQKLSYSFYWCRAGYILSSVNVVARWCRRFCGEYFCACKSERNIHTGQLRASLMDIFRKSMQLQRQCRLCNLHSKYHVDRMLFRKSTYSRANPVSGVLLWRRLKRMFKFLWYLLPAPAGK